MTSVMKKRLAGTAAALLLFGQAASTGGQVIYNTGGAEMLQVTQQNLMNQIMVNDLTNPIILSAGAAAGAAAERERIEKIGAAKIKAGKTTLTYAPTVTATQTLVKSLSFDKTAPPDIAGRMRFIQRYVELFNRLAAINKFTVNDSADGYVFACALSFAAYNDKELDRAQIQQLRRDTKQMLLENLFYQGTSDLNRQYTYELNASLAAQAIEQRAFYRRATTAEERQKYDERAKFFAKFVLDTKKNLKDE